MIEETKDFGKKLKLKDEEILSLLQQRKASALLVDDWPDNTQRVFKIADKEENPIIKEFEKGRSAAYWNVLWKYNGVDVPILLRTSRSSYDRFKEKLDAEKFEYKGKYCIFAKGVNDENQSYHSVSRPMDSEGQTFVDPLDVIKSAQEGTETLQAQPKEDFSERASAFVSDFMIQVGTINKQKEDEGKPEEKIVPNVMLVAAKYLMKHYREEYDAIRDAF